MKNVQEKLKDDICVVLNRYHFEERLTVAEAIGVLEIVKLDLYLNALEEQKEKEG